MRAFGGKNIGFRVLSFASAFKVFAGARLPQPHRKQTLNPKLKAKTLNPNAKDKTLNPMFFSPTAHKFQTPLCMLARLP